MTMLHDLDELTLQVRSPEVRTYVAESVRALRAGALRSAVLSLWVAVVFDIIEKIRELAASGDPQASSEVSRLDGWIATGSVQALQAFETGILQLAHSQYEFLSTLELADLERLRQDRHRCAHPAFTADGALYQPSPEQVRAYTVAAVQALLAHPPVQGRSALNRLQAEVGGLAFPQQVDLVVAYLGPKYLDRGKASLVANIVALFLKDVVSPTPHADRSRALHVLTAVNQRQHATYWQVMSRRLPDLVSQAAEPQLENVLAVLASDQHTWNVLPEAEKVRLQAFVTQAQVPEVLLIAHQVPPLAAQARTRLHSLHGDVLVPALLAHPSEALAPLAVDRLVEAKTYREGWQFLDTVQAMLEFLSEGDLKRVLAAARTNDQIHSAGNIPQRLTTLLRSTASRWPQLQAEWVELAQTHPKLTSLGRELRELGWLAEDPAP